MLSCVRVRLSLVLVTVLLVQFFLPAMDRSAACMQAGMQALHVSCKPLSRRGVLPHLTFSASTSDIDLA
jgi:hypothetical protein